MAMFAHFDNLWQFLRLKDLLANFENFGQFGGSFAGRIKANAAVLALLCLEDKRQCSCVCIVLLRGQNTAQLCLHCFAWKIKASAAVLAMFCLEDKSQRCCACNVLLGR